MKINLVRVDGKIEKIIHNETLMDFVFDEMQGKAFFIFNSSIDKCCVDNVISIDDKEAMLSGDYDEITIAETPAGLGLIAIIVSVVAIAVAALVYFSLEVPEVGKEGANNSLTNRQNRERPLQRIEDIAGEVRAYPTLIADNYKKFDANNNEIEYSLMCVGKGEFDIRSVRDSSTLISNIQDAGAMFYGPNTLPGTDAPQYVFGQSFNEEVRIIKRSNEVSGNAALESGADLTVTIDTGAATAFQSAPTGTETGTIVLDPNLTNNNFGSLEVGEQITLSFVFDDVTPLSLDGQYEIDSISLDNFTIVLKDPNDLGVNNVNPNWNLIPTSETNKADAEFAPVDAEERAYLGPYFLASEDRTEFYVNIASNGIKSSSGGRAGIVYHIEYAQADDEGNRIGNWIVGPQQFFSGETNDRVGKTNEVVTSFTGPCLVRLKKDGIIWKDIVQAVKLDALYSVEPLNAAHFGDVTTVQVRTVANSTSTQVKQRKFNCLVKRKLNVVQPDGTLGAFEPTNRFIDYYIYASLNDRIGRRTLDEINVQEIYDNYVELIDYFGSEEAAYFNYTFDDDQVSFQDTLTYICEATFSKAVRRGGILSTNNILPKEPETIFTHRNKIPGEQTITRKFENEGLKDGVEFQYVDPRDNSRRTIYIPQDQSALKPEKVESIGIRNHNQAWWHAWRRYNQLKYQRIIMSDRLTSDGALLSLNQVVAITNNTKGNAQSGDVTAVQGLLLTLSEPVDFSDMSAAYSITLRKRDGSLETIGCSAGIDANQVVLDSAPSEEIYTGYEEDKTVFIFNKDGLADADKYIITEIDRTNIYDVPIKAINYTDQYYERDGEQSPNN